MFSEKKVFCPECQRQGVKSKVFLYSQPDPKFTGGYWNENGDWVKPDVDIKPPFYICTNSPAHNTNFRNSPVATGMI